MTRVFALLLGCFAATAVAVVDPAPPCARDTGASCAADAPFLWEVKGAKTTHYLMGSVHLLPQSAYPLPAALNAAYNAAESLVFESDLTALAAPKNQMQMLADAQAPEGGLKGLIGAPLYLRVQEYANNRKLSPAICDSFKAWFCALTLEVLTFTESEYRPDLGLDQHFYAQASTAKKSILWLEEPAAHLKLFSAMPDTVALQMLTATLDQGGSDGTSPEELLKAWQENDVAALEQLAARFKQEAPELHERLLTARNRAWMPRLTQLLGGESKQLIMVGAAHLVGPDGLVALLKAAGLAVVPYQPLPATEETAPQRAE